MTEPLKVILNLPPRSVERLDKLQADCEAENYGEVIRYAIQLYEWMVSVHKAGCSLAKVEPDGTFTKLEVFSLSGVTDERDTKAI